MATSGSPGFSTTDNTRSFPYAVIFLLIKTTYSRRSTVSYTRPTQGTTLMDIWNSYTKWQRQNTTFLRDVSSTTIILKHSQASLVPHSVLFRSTTLSSFLPRARSTSESLSKKRRFHASAIWHSP